MAGVALGDMELRFAWQPWHLVTWTFVLRGRRGTSATGLVARNACDAPDAAIVLRGRRGTWCHGCAFCVAGVALDDMDLRLSNVIATV